MFCTEHLHDFCRCFSHSLFCFSFFPNSSPFQPPHTASSTGENVSSIRKKTKQKKKKLSQKLLCMSIFNLFGKSISMNPAKRNGPVQTLSPVCLRMCNGSVLRKAPPC